jgi:serine phosphatase RsbU (regulator of sigma subunit)
VHGEPPDLAVLTDLDRLGSLRAAGLLDAPASEDFDRVTRMAAELLDAPVVLVTLVDAERQFFLSCVGLGRPLSDERETPLSHSFCQYVVAGEEPLVIEDARAVPWLRDNGSVTELGVVAYAGCPLYAGDEQPLGSFCALDDKPRRWTERELGLLRDFTAIVQSELDLRAARDDARRGSLLLARLQRLTDAAAARELDALLEQLLAACAAAFDANIAVIDLFDARGGLRRRAARGLAAGAAPPRMGAGFTARGPTGEQTLTVDDLRAVGAAGGHKPAGSIDAERALAAAGGLRSTGARSLLAAPLIADQRLQGAVCVGSRVAGAYGEADRQLLALAADRFAAAIARAGAYDRERQVARTLEAALRPARLPSVDGVRLAARYLPAVREVGGDWYDVFRLPGGSLGIAIGDVVGHGVEQAAEALRLRYALRGAVLEGCAPAAALASLNRHAVRHPGAYASTVAYLELDPGSRLLRWSSAGHLSGVVACGGAGEWLGLADGPPLGIDREGAWPGAERLLEPGSRVVLFTDGLIERRAEPLDDGIDRIAAAAATAPDLEDLCDKALEQAPAPRSDDLALVALQLD